MLSKPPLIAVDSGRIPASFASIAGRLLRINIDMGALTCVASDLGVVRAIDVAPDGVVAV